MWVVYCFVSYLALALLIPAGWALVPIWLRARKSRHVYCPAASHIETVALAPWYALSMPALGNQEVCFRACSQWPRACMLTASHGSRATVSKCEAAGQY